MKYFYPKKKFYKKRVNFMQLFFDNGDYFSLEGSEIADLKLNFYDRLVVGERGFCPVVESGFIKLKVKKRNIDSFIFNKHFLYNAEEYKRGRKTYIENRLVSDGGISHVRFFDRNYWYDTLYGNIAAEAEGEFLVLNFSPQEKFGAADGKNHVILLKEICKTIVEGIDLDFESGGIFCVYNDEILDLQLQFEEKLIRNVGDLFRNIKDGFIKIKLDEEAEYRKTLFLPNDNKAAIKKIEERLCPNGPQSEHDICRLHINFDYAGFGCPDRTERVEIEDIRPDEEVERLARLEEYDEFSYYSFVGGYCEKLSDGTILITFGKNAENLLKKVCCQ